MYATLALLGVCVLLAAGCGSQETAEVPTPAEARQQLAAAPAPLAAIHRQANELLDGGKAAFERRMAALRGRPVVVNAWGSWCPPCREEFPLFQRAAVAHGTRVAFLGIDVEDPPGDARAFLDDHWIAYPSYADRQREIAEDIGVPVGLPTTFFFDRRGRMSYMHQGPYRDEAALAADIRRYARST